MTSATVDLDPESEAPTSFRERLADWLNSIQFVLYTTLVLGLLALGFLWQRMFIVVHPGQRGVMYRTLKGGTVLNSSLGEGLHIIPPWDKMFLYDIRLQQKTLDFKVLSDEGLTLGVHAVVRYRPYEEMLGHLQQDIGPGYFASLIRPEIESHIRRTFGGRPAHEIYASVRDVLQELGQFPLIGRTENSASGMISRPYIYVQELKLTQIDLPKIVEEAIVEKYHQEQLMLAYQYKLQREEKEADRKRTEAAGIRDFNLIAGKVSPDMLRWRSIDATVELAKSNNSKMIVLGGGQQPAMAMQLNLGEALGSPPPANSIEKEPAQKQAVPKQRTQKKTIDRVQVPPPAANNEPSGANSP